MSLTLDHTAFVARLRAAACDKCGSVAAAGRACGIPRTTMETYTLKGGFPGAANLVSLSNVLGVSVDWLLTGNSNARGNT